MRAASICACRAAHFAFQRYARALPTRRASSAPPLSALNARCVALEARHAHLSAEVSRGDLDARALTASSRELAALERTVAAISVYRAAAAEVADLESIVADGGGGGGGGGEESLAGLAHAELAESARPALIDAEAALLRLLVPRDEADSRDAILEVRAGVGGEEAALFAGEVLRMYEQYASTHGWGWSVMFMQSEAAAARSSGSGGGGDGVREAVVSVTGEGAFGRLRFESGVHRVQRVPTTQSTGKLQTSTMTVAVLPEAEEVDVTIRPADLRIDTYRAQGAGGQHVNTTDSAVRITHLPTGLVVAIQDERSQIQNRAKALRVLRARLYDAERAKLAETRSKDRKAQIGTSSRSDRVRTYNFTQNRVTDHRVAISKHDVASVMRGEALDEFIDALIKEELDELVREHLTDAS